MLALLNIWDHTSADEFLIGAAAVVTAIGLLVAAVVRFWRKVIRPIIAFVRRVSAALGLVEKELMPNGGNSVKDQLGQLVHTNQQQNERIERIERTLNLRPPEEPM